MYEKHKIDQLRMKNQYLSELLTGANEKIQKLNAVIIEKDAEINALHCDIEELGRAYELKSNDD